MLENENSQYFSKSVNHNIPQYYYPYPLSNSSTNASNIQNNSVYNSNITFYIDFSTGQKYIFNDNQYNSFELTLNKFLKEKKLENYKNKIKCVLCDANKVDFSKTLIDNNIKQNCHVLCYIDDSNNTNNIEDIYGKGFRYYARVSKAGCDFKGNVKINQDTTIVYVSVGNIKGFNLFGVLDGHGSHGHYVSEFCRNHFIKEMNLYANKCKTENICTPEEIYFQLKTTNFDFIKDCFQDADDQMSKQNIFEYNMSGTTCNLVIQLNKYLICANVGDSRSILVYDNDTQTNQGLINLSIDHIPNLPHEYQRIIKNGGMIGKYKYQNGGMDDRLRIFKPGQKFPGISLSRTLGDFMAKDCGVITEPDILEYKLTHKSKYLLICSDGVWKHLTNQDVRNLGEKYFQKGEIVPHCTLLVKKAVQEWKKVNMIRDDITIVCVYF